MKDIIVKGDILYSKDSENVYEYPNSYLVVKNGKIDSIKSTIDEKKGVEDILSNNLSYIDYYDYTGKLIIPGMTDLHLHAPQYHFTGLHMDMELLDWLDTYTFPNEAKYKDIDFAKKAYTILVNDLLKTPTTRFSMFSSLHKDATLLLIDILTRAGFKGYVGKVNMNRNSPNILIETTKDSIDDTIEIIEKTKENNNIKPIITPRFIPSCTDDLLESLSKISRDYNLPIQSHLCENHSEKKWVNELVPDEKSYSAAYHKFNLFGEYNNTIMAHVVWPDEDDISLLKNNKVWVAHCPSSNMNLSSGIAPIKKMMGMGIKIGLGTDVAGGSTLSLFDTIKETIQCSKMRMVYNNYEDKPLNVKEALYLATVGGGEFFGKVGRFDKNYEADIVVIDDTEYATMLYGELSLIERFERFIYRPSHSVVAKFVAGNKLDLCVEK